MPSSKTRSQSDDVSRASPRFMGCVAAEWRSGVWASLLVAFVVPIWWRLGAGCYESRAVLERDLAAASQAEEPARSSPPADRRSKSSEDLRLLQEAVRGDRLVPVPALGLVDALKPSPPIMVHPAVGGSGLEVVCRAADADAAYGRCERVTRAALSLEGAFRLARQATVPKRPLPIPYWPMLLLGVACGIVAGGLWMILSGLVKRRSGTASPRAARGSGRPSRASEKRAPADRSAAQTGAAATARPVSAAVSGSRGAPTAPEWAADDTMDKEAFAGRVDTATSLQAVCNQLRARSGRGCFVVGVSSLPEGRARKSEVALGLALSLADGPPSRVLLVEADFDNPAVDKTAKISMPPLAGFSQQIQMRNGSGQRRPWRVVGCGAHLSVLAEGRVRTPGMLLSEQFSSALADLRNNFDIVVVDGPVVGSDSETQAFGQLADGVVFALPPTAQISDAVATTAKWFGNKQLVTVLTS